MKKIKNTEYKKYRLYGMIGMTAVFLLGALVGFIVSPKSIKNGGVPGAIELVQKSSEATCARIEKLLTMRLQPVEVDDAESHIENAKIYANLSERGCPENSENYKELARQELEIARALNDDSIDDKQETTEIVETYKRIQMQAEAERMIEKAKKLTNPAIDFIIQLERIINED